MWRDDAYILDIILAARKAGEYLGEKSLEDLAEDELVQDAIVRKLEIIGEAAAKLSEEIRAAHPEIPWHEMSGMRNRLIHEYFRVDLEKVWTTVKQDLPGLIDLLAPLVPPEE